MYKLVTNFNRSNSAINIHVEEDKFIFNDTTFLLDDLKNSPEFRPFCNFAFPLSNMFKVLIRVENTDLVYYKSALAKPFDTFSQSFNTKSKFLNHFHPTLDFPVTILFYPETKNFKDAHLTVIKQDDHVPFEVTTTNDNGEKVPYVPDYDGPYIPNYVLPKCLLASSPTVPKDGTIVSFTYRDLNSVEQSVNFEASIKTDKGYISHNKIDIVNGKASFKFIPLGLSSGEKVTIQAGIGRFTNVAKLELTVE